MSTNDNERHPRDRRRLNDLEQSRKAHERLGWSTENIDAMTDQANRWHELLERRAVFAEAAEQTTGHVQLTYEEEIQQIDEVLAAPVIERIGKLEAEADHLETQIENFDTRDSAAFEGTKEKAQADLEELREEIGRLRQSLADSGVEDLLPDADGEEEAEAMSQRPFAGSSGGFTSGDFERPQGTASDGATKLGSQ